MEKKLKALQRKYGKGEGRLSEIVNRGFVWSDLNMSNGNDKPLDVLFLGMNPSYLGDDGNDFYGYDPHEKDGYRRYFNPFHTLIEQVKGQARNLSVNWTLMDLLYFRETKQHVLLKLLSENDGVNAFVDQLRLSMERIEDLKPKLIVVCNAGAASFTGIEAGRNASNKEVGVWMGYQFEFDDDLGVYRIKEELNPSPDRINERMETTQLAGTPLIFASNLTYMSKYLKRTVAWQIKNVLIKTSNH